MQMTTRIATIRGAGLAFPVACLIYVFTGHTGIFALIFAGALVGFLAGAYNAARPDRGQERPATVRSSAGSSGRPGWLVQLLLHPNLLVRLASLIVFAAALLLAAWVVGYSLLPEAAFRGGAAAHMARGGLENASVTAFEEWGKIFRANLVPVVLILAGSLVMRVNGFSFGYLVALVNVVGYGLFLGTNSFAIPMAERMAPSLAVLERSGPLEMLGLIVLAAASAGWARFEVKQIFRTVPERVNPKRSPGAIEIAAALAGIAILAAANWREAWMVMGAGLP